MWGRENFAGFLYVLRLKQRSQIKKTLELYKLCCSVPITFAERTLVIRYARKPARRLARDPIEKKKKWVVLECGILGGIPI